MRIYAVIVTYNGMQHQWIERCLESLRESSLEVTPIVIDNLSTDGTREFVPCHYPDAIWMPQERNLGFGQANNIGIKYALDHNADFVLLLNQDATISRNALELMAAASDGESLLSPVHLNGDGTRLDEMFRIALKPKDELFYAHLLMGKELKASYETEEICAACWLLPVKVIRKIGGFNPLFFHYGEDNNYYQRLVYHKTKTLLVPNATMCHDRTFYGNEKAFNKNRYHRDVLLITTNINFSFSKVLFQLARLLFRTYSYDRSHYKIGSFAKEMIWTTIHLSSIRNSRRTDKRDGTSWL
ncbi:MAG: glycosyltransferase family 2 protein [Prevotella sp.]|nr:glycosyltransferase family 2 protein [Prevotella sp.]